MLRPALDRTDEILVAAQSGATETLLFDLAARVSGELEGERLAVQADEPARDDLMNFAAVLVLRCSGAVEPLDAEVVPGDGPMAAVLRYPFPAATATAPASAGR